MDARRAPDLNTPKTFTDVDFIDEAITDADWAAMSDEERAFIQEGLDAADRGDLVPHEEVMAFLLAQLDKYRAR